MCVECSRIGEARARVYAGVKWYWSEWSGDRTDSRLGIEDCRRGRSRVGQAAVGNGERCCVKTVFNIRVARIRTGRGSRSVAKRPRISQNNPGGVRGPVSVEGDRSSFEG